MRTGDRWEMVRRQAIARASLRFLMPAMRTPEAALAQTFRPSARAAALTGTRLPSPSG